MAAHVGCNFRDSYAQEAHSEAELRMSGRKASHTRAQTGQATGRGNAAEDVVIGLNVLRVETGPMEATQQSQVREMRIGLHNKSVKPMPSP